MADPTNDAVAVLVRAVATQAATAEAIARTQDAQGATLDALVRIVEGQSAANNQLAEAVRGMTHQLGRVQIRQAEMIEASRKRAEEQMAKMKALLGPEPPAGG